MTNTKTFISRRETRDFGTSVFKIQMKRRGKEAEYYNIVETQHCLNT